MKKNILIALPNDNLGGAEQYLKNIAAYFLNNGFRVYVFFLKRPISNAWDNLKDKQIEFYYTNSKTEKFGVYPFLKNIFNKRNLNYEYAFTSHIHLNSFIGILIKLNIVKTRLFIGRESTSTFKRYTGFKLLTYKFLYFIGYQSLDLLICQSSFMKDQFVKALPQLSKKIKIEVIPNPINLVAIANSPKTAIKNHSFRNYIISAGRLIPEKGFDLLIDAFSQIKIKHPDLNLVILGEGEKRGELEQKIQDYKLNDSIYLPGFVKNVYPYFKRAKLCVVSSRIEGFPNVLLQMMSQNDKVVSTTCAGGIDEIPNIFLSGTNNTHSLEKAILDALNTDTTPNRTIFDDFLKKRSVENFVREIEKHLEHA